MCILGICVYFHIIWCICVYFGYMCVFSHDFGDFSGQNTCISAFLEGLGNYVPFSGIAIWEPFGKGDSRRTSGKAIPEEPRGSPSPKKALLKIQGSSSRPAPSAPRPPLAHSHLLLTLQQLPLLPLLPLQPSHLLLAFQQLPLQPNKHCDFKDNGVFIPFPGQRGGAPALPQTLGRGG